MKKKYIFKTSVFEKEKIPLAVSFFFFFLQDKSKVKVFPRLVYEELDQFEKFLAFTEKILMVLLAVFSYTWHIGDSLLQLNISSP